MVGVLMVAEKPSLALSIAQILSNHKCVSRKGFNGACSVHEWTGSFQGLQGVKFKMTSVCGHVNTLDFPSKYNNWDRVDPSDLFYCSTEKKEATPKLKMPAFLAAEAKNNEFLVLWLDCDKEGENICFEVMNCVLDSMKRPQGGMRQVHRAKFSSITDKDIKLAMNTLVEPDENQSKSVDARQELDLRIGCAFTRFQTKFFQGKYGDLDSSLISYGPCQTPTLGFCVGRHDIIQTFKPETYWTIAVKVKTEIAGRQLVLDWDRQRCFDKEVAQLFLSDVKSHKYAAVTNISSKEKAKERPIALNTVELMRVASSGLGMGPHHAMQIAEKLYIQGFISYPRTESTHYSENFDLKDALRQHQNSSDWGAEVRELLSQGINKPKKGHDAGDHPPITPMRAASRDQLDGDSWRVYDYVVRHFIASLSRNCKYLSTVITITIGDESFSMTGKKTIDPGFTAVMTWQTLLEDDENLPTVNKGDQLIIDDVRLLEKQTSPPDYLTESDLITLMEKHGIGTDASIPVHINNICQRNYVTIGAGRKLIPTTLGIVLVHGYLKIDPDLVHPQMRSAVEEQLDLIAHGRANFKSVLKHTLEIFKLKFQYFVSNISGMDQLFEVSFSTLAESGRPFSRCGKCRRFMKYVMAKPSRLYCNTCDETLNLPQNGNIKLYQELKCPLDDFEILYVTAGGSGKSYVFCPYCYNNPPFSEMRKDMGCNSCTHPTCPHGQNSNGVSQCVECEEGILVLDPASIPKWKLGCNRCDVIIRLFNDAAKVSVLDEKNCSECDAQIMKVEYKEGKTKLEDGELTAEGCIYCDDKLSRLVEKHHAVLMRRRPNRQGMGRGGAGRGRGKPGRGRGGKRGKVPKDKMAQLAAYFV